MSLVREGISFLVSINLEEATPILYAYQLHLDDQEDSASEVRPIFVLPSSFEGSAFNTNSSHISCMNVCSVFRCYIS